MKKRVRFKKILNLLFYCVDMDFYSYKYRKCKNKSSIERKGATGVIF